MADIAVLQARLDVLEAAMDSGTMRVRDGDHEVQYRTMAEMVAAASRLRARIAGSQSRSPLYPSFSRD